MILKKFFTENLEKDTIPMEIPDYLVYLSKQNCDYKALIKAIKTSCQYSNLHIHFQYVCKKTIYLKYS